MTAPLRSGRLAQRLTTPLLRLQGLGRDRSGVPVLSDLTLDIPAGQVIALVGESGAGKSTLAELIGGLLPPSRGRMLWRGKPYAPASPAEATTAGIACIHQEPNLFPGLSVAENLFIGNFPRLGGLFVNRRAMRRRTREVLSRLGLDIHPESGLDALSPGERQLLEIARALQRDAALVVFDDPAAALSPREGERLLAGIQGLAASGKTVIHISRSLAEARRLADRIVVLRDGRVVEDGPADGLDLPRLARAATARDPAAPRPARTAPPRDRPLLEVRGLSAPGLLADVSLTLREGEILGLFGLKGSGRGELARLLMGLGPAARGEVRLAGRRLSGGPRARIRQGLAFVPRDRRGEGLIPGASLRDNLALPAIESLHGAIGLDRDLIEDMAQDLRDALRLRARRLDRQPVGTLPGGDQQKVAIGRWLPASPRLLILDEPTRGVETAARPEIHALLDRLAAQGMGLLVVSSSPEELTGLCDRIAVMSRGEVVATLDHADFDEGRLLAAALGQRPEEEAA